MERLISGGALALGCVLACSAAMAAPPAPPYTTDDTVKTFQAPPAAAPSAAPTGECEKKGMVTGDDGVCEPAKNERGFSLPTRATLGSGAKGTSSPAARPQPVSAPARPAAPRAAPRRDLL